jgi:hypothetical protein
MEVSGWISPRPLCFREKGPGSHPVGGWVGFSVVQDRLQKIKDCYNCWEQN